MAGMREIRNSFRMQVDEPERKISLGRQRCTWKVSTTTEVDLKEMGFEVWAGVIGREEGHMALNLIRVMNHQAPYKT